MKSFPVDAFIEAVTNLSNDNLTSLIAQSESEGWVFVRRLVDEWNSGINRFDRSGEKLFIASVDGRTVGTCGLNIDPYIADASVGRVRRLFVIPSCRGQGIGEKLVQTVKDAACGRFATLRLRTTNPVAARLYESMGFQPVQGLWDTTHIMELDQFDCHIM